MQGRFCIDVGPEAIRSSGFACALSTKDPPSSLIEFSSDYLERLVFAEGAQNQIIKNRCLSERLNVLTEDQKKRDAWTTTLILTWMSKKKVELINRICNKDYWPKVASLYNQVYGALKGPQILSKNLENGTVLDGDPQLQKYLTEPLRERTAICGKVGAHSKDVFKYSIPVINTPQLLAQIETFRSLVIIKKTGRPITDDEILSLDLSQKGLVKFVPSDLFDSTLTGMLSQIAQVRNAVTEKIQAAQKAGPTGVFPSDLQDYMFNDGTIIDVMKNESLISGTHGEVISDGAACILARHQNTLSGKLADVAISALVFGGIAKKFLQESFTLARLASTSAGLSGAKVLLPELIDSCTPGSKRWRRSTEILDNPVLMQRTVGDLPKEIGFGLWKIQFDPTKTPSCQEAQQRNLIMDPSEGTSCWQAILEMIYPLSGGVSEAF